STQRSKFYFLVTDRCLPEAGKSLGHVVLFAIDTTCSFSHGMITHPIKHHLSEALLHDFPGKRIALRQSATKQFYTVPIIEGLSTSIVVDLTHAAICKC